MAAESAADRASFFDIDEFGVEASYSAAAADSAATVNGILREASRDEFNDRVLTREAPTFQCRAADLPAGAAPGEHTGDTLTISGRVFFVRAIMPDGTGLAELVLEEQTTLNAN